MERLTETLICRICLKIVDKKSRSYGFIDDANGNLRDMMLCCVPEMDLYVSSDPIICFSCIQLLVNMYNFKTRCMNVETIIRSYIERTNLSEFDQVNLSLVVQDLMNINKEQEERWIKASKAESRESRNQIEENNLPYFNTPPGSDVNNISSHHNSSFVPNNISPFYPPLKHLHSQTSVLQNSLKSPEPEGNLVDTATALSHTGLIPPMGYCSLETKTNGTLLIVAPISSSGTNNEIHPTPYFPHVLSPTSRNEAESEMQQEQSNVLESPIVDSNPESKDQSFEHPIESNLRLVVKIPRSKITVPFQIDEVEIEGSNENKIKIKDFDGQIDSLDPDPGQKIIMDEESGLPLEQREDKIFICSCMYLSTSETLFNKHKTVCKNGLDSFKCPHCPHTTYRQYALNRHINTMHTKAQWFHCDHCTYRSTDKAYLRKHMRKYHEQPIKTTTDYTCKICDYVCTSEYNLGRHQIRHDTGTNMTCEFCSYTSRDRSNFRKHIFTHSAKMLECDFCQYLNGSPYQMRIHLKKNHDGVGVEDIDCKSDRPLSELIIDIRASIEEARNAGNFVV